MKKDTRRHSLATTTTPLGWKVICNYLLVILSLIQKLNPAKNFKLAHSLL